MTIRLVRLILPPLAVLACAGCPVAERAERERLRAEVEAARAENRQLQEEVSHLRAELDKARKAVPTTREATPERGVVTGKVLYKGQPLPGGIVAFLRPDGQIAHGRIQDDGTYSLPEIPVGDLKVTVTTVKPIPPPPGFARPGGQGKEAGKGEPIYPAGKYIPIPERYSKPDKSDLTCSVKPGRQEFNIELHD